MRIYVIRHGQSVANARVAHAGWEQVPLTEKGVEQAKRTGELIKDLKFDKVITSDLLRAMQTADYALPGYEKQRDWRIRETGVGSISGKRVHECEEELGESYLRNRRNRDFTPYGGENLEMFQKRVSEFMDDLTKEPEDATIAVVCHEGAMICMLRHVVDCKLSYLPALADNCCVCVFTYQSGSWILNKWNETGNVVPEA